MIGSDLEMDTTSQRFIAVTKVWTVACLFAASCFSAQAELGIETDFPGGSGVIRSVDQEKRVISIDPTDHPGKGWRCWWYVRLTGIPRGEVIQFEVGDAPWS